MKTKLIFLGLLLTAVLGIARVTAIQRISQVEAKTILDKKATADAAYAAYEKAHEAVCAQEKAVSNIHGVPTSEFNCSYGPYTFSTTGVGGSGFARWHFTEDYNYLVKE